MISISYLPPPPPPPPPHFQGCALSGSDTSRKCLSLAYRGRFWVLCTLRLSLTLLALAPAMLYLSACRTSDSLHTQSQLHDVSDTEHTFRLAPVDRSQYENYSLIGDEDEEGDPNAIMRFEMCLNDVSGHAMPQTCFNAFRNHLGEPIFFTIDAVSKAALTPEELSYVSGLERSWKSFRRASKRQSRNENTLVIGSSAVAVISVTSVWNYGGVAANTVSDLDLIKKVMDEALTRNRSGT